MTAQVKMRHLFWRFWWASPSVDARFKYPGLYLWAFGRNLRILPLARR